MSRYSEVKPSKKQLHYSITPIQDINVWRHEQVLKDIKREQWHKDRRDDIAYRMEKNIINNKVTSVSTTTKSWKRYFDNEAAKQEKHTLTKDTQSVRYTAHKPSILGRILNRLSTWFLSIKF